VTASRRTGAVLWRTAFLLIFGVYYLYLVLGPNSLWLRMWPYTVIGILGVVSGLLMLLLVPWARFPIYTLAAFFIFDSGVSAYYYVVHDPTFGASPWSTRIIGALISLLPIAILLNITLSARRLLIDAAPKPN
jgi:hypothetical protein